jgi:molecular chaperone DnaK (HSP70)
VEKNSCSIKNRLQAQHNTVSANVVTVQNCSPFKNNLWKSFHPVQIRATLLDGRRARLEEQTGEFVNDVSVI